MTPPTLPKIFASGTPLLVLWIKMPLIYPPLDAKMLSTYLMVASLHASKEESYYQAYAQLQAALALPSATLDAPTVRAAAVAAFNAEQRHRSSTSRTPDSVLGFAAAAAGFRRPFTGTSTPASSCCRCPHHCVLPDGTFRVVHPVEAHIAAVPDRDPEADVSNKTLRANKAYKAAITDPTTSRADIALLTGDLREKRQDDRDRARYYRMQEEEDAILAIAAARDYDSDEWDACASLRCVCSLLCRACSQCFIYATGGFVHISPCALSIFVLYFCPHFGVGRLPVLNPVNREAVPLVHTFCVFLCCLFSLSIPAPGLYYAYGGKALPFCPRMASGIAIFEHLPLPPIPQKSRAALWDFFEIGAKEEGQVELGATPY